MTNYNDFDLDVQISQSQGDVSPQSLSVRTDVDCFTVKVTEIVCTNVPTMCWECETSDICGDGSGDEKSISQCRSYCGSSC